MINCLRRHFHFFDFKLKEMKSFSVFMMFGLMCSPLCAETNGDVYNYSIMQGTIIKGAITDQAGNPVIGANIVIKGKSSGTISDFDGNFSLDVSVGDELEISFIGYRTQKIVVKNSSPLKIILLEDTKFLDDVVVVGYGVQKKKLVTGATIQVKGEDIQKLNTVSPLAALQSQTPGVSITKVSGQPGSSYKVNIRGLGTIGDSEPLYVIDGLPGNIDYLNPADIASIDVLKDAASAAIYGARGANGVVLITTKKGNKDKASIEYNGYVGFQNFVRNGVRTLNAQEYAMIMEEGHKNSGKPIPDFASLVPAWDDIQSGEWNGTDWLDAGINNNALMQNHSININGGSGKSVYALSFSYTNQEGVFGKPADPGYERYTGMINTEHVIISGKDFDILKVGENFRYKLDKKSSISTGGSQTSVRKALATNPFLPIYDENGEFHYAIDWESDDANPSGMLYYTQKDNETFSHSLNGDFYIELQPVKKFIIRSSFGYNYSNSSSRSYQPKYQLSNKSFCLDDYVKQSQSNSWNWRSETTANYTWNFSKKHNFNAMAGFTASKSGYGFSINGMNYYPVFSDFEHAYLDNTPNVISGKTELGGAPSQQNSSVSAFGRINYDYKETYMATVVMRGDASSKFARNHRWGFFPSVSAGWVISNENFMKQTSSWLDFLKFRASWGRNGNNNISAFQYIPQIAMDGKYFFGDTKDNAYIASYPANVANEDITWETSEQIDLGIDSRFLSSRLGLVFDWYRKITKDWLVVAPIPAIYGADPSVINGGEVENKGFEIGLNWRDQINKFNYYANFNLGYNKNKVIKIENKEGIIMGKTGIPWTNCKEIYRAQEGYPIGYFIGYKTDGIFQNEEEVQNYKNEKGELIMPDAVPGDIRFVDTNEDGVITDEDRVMIGDPNPDFTFGLSLGAGYKGFDFNITANGVAGNQIFKAYRHATVANHNYTSDFLDRWHGEGTSNTIPRITVTGHINDVYPSERHIEDADYLRISNITLGYDFKYIFKRLPLQQARVYLACNNIATITKYTGFDPEVGWASENWASGVDLGYYPAPRVVMFGISLKY